MAETNILAFLLANISNNKGSLKSLKPEPDVIKLHMAEIYNCLQYTRVLVCGRPFQPSLMFMGKAKTFPRLKGLKNASFW
jgi:hypothetical protein